MVTKAEIQNFGRGFGGHRRYGSVALAGALVAAIVIFAFAFTFVLIRPAKADGNPANLNSAAIAYTLTSQLKWVTRPNGAIQAGLSGYSTHPSHFFDI